MEHEKKYTAKEAAIAVLKKAEEILKKSAAFNKGIHEQTASGSPANAIGHQQAPENNPKEQAEGNNPLAGTTPTQIGQDGKPKPGFDEMRGHLKLAKFMGLREAKRQKKAAAVAPAPHQESDEKQGG